MKGLLLIAILGSARAAVHVSTSTLNEDLSPNKGVGFIKSMDSFLVGTNSLKVMSTNNGGILIGNGKLDPDDLTISDVVGIFYERSGLANSCKR